MNNKLGGEWCVVSDGAVGRRFCGGQVGSLKQFAPTLADAHPGTEGSGDMRGQQRPLSRFEVTSCRTA